MFESITTLNFAEQAFIGFAVLVGLVSVVGIAMAYYYVKKEAG